MPIPKHGLPVDHALNLNQSRANCSSRPSAVISPAEGAFSVTGLESLGEVCDCGEGQRARGRGEEEREGGTGTCTGQAGLDPSGVIGKGGLSEPQFGIIL